VRFENQSNNKKFYYKFDGDGLRYEIAEFSSMIRREERETFRLRKSESRWMARVLESARTDAHVFG
jgi:choline-phosphate cytidylyltransferase